MTTKQQLTKKINDISVKLKDGIFKDKQDMDNLTFEREKLIFGLSVVEEFESRSCESCKHWGETFKHYNKCKKGLCDDIMKNKTSYDFYCNKYQKKENK